MATTSKGIYYPTSSDQIVPLESVLANIAQSADAAIPLSGTEAVTFSGTSANSTQVATISFPSTLSSAPSKILVTVRGPVSGSSAYVATVTNSTTTNFSVLLHRLSAGSAQAINVVWAVL